jgi:hypothetical protein
MTILTTTYAWTQNHLLTLSRNGGRAAALILVWYAE